MLFKGSIIDRVSRAFNDTNSPFLNGLSKRMNQDLIYSSLEVIKEVTANLFWSRKNIGNLKAVLKAEGHEEPYKDNSAFCNHKVQAESKAVPLSFSQVLENADVKRLFEQFNSHEERLTHTSLIMNGFTGCVWHISDNLYGDGAQSFAEAVLDSSVFYQVYEAHGPDKRGAAMRGMARLIEMSQHPETERCPEAFVSKLCNSIVIAAMLRDAEPIMAADLLSSMFHGYLPLEAADRVKAAPVLGLLAPSCELAIALEYKEMMPYEFVNAVIDNAGCEIVDPAIGDEGQSADMK